MCIFSDVAVSYPITNYAYINMDTYSIIYNFRKIGTIMNIQYLVTK
jgi:hypothetical protein